MIGSNFLATIKLASQRQEQNHSLVVCTGFPAIFAGYECFPRVVISYYFTTSLLEVDLSYEKPELFSCSRKSLRSKQELLSVFLAHFFNAISAQWKKTAMDPDNTRR